MLKLVFQGEVNHLTAISKLLPWVIGALGTKGTTFF